MNYLYAQLDENNICRGISQLAGEVIRPNMIRLTEQEYARNLLGKQYDNGVWSDVENAETL